MAKIKHIVQSGMKFGELRIVQKVADDTKTKSPNLVKRWRVECSCGKRMTIPQYYITRANNPKTHCGHLDKTIKTHFKQEYQIWYMMRVRCNNPNHVSYKDYGGRGIKVCDEWMCEQTGFEKFLKHVKPRPTPKHTIDRIEVNGNYEPGNIRWATPKEQAANKRKK